MEPWEITLMEWSGRLGTAAGHASAVMVLYVLPVVFVLSVLVLIVLAFWKWSKS